MKIKLFLVCMAAMISSSCDVDLFNSSCHDLGSTSYSLCKSEEGPTIFYLEPIHQAPEGGGVLDGTVQLIGWNKGVIVATRQSTFRGDPDGIMVVDLSTKKITGPISSEMANKEYSDIKLLKPDEVWNSSN